MHKKAQTGTSAATLIAVITGMIVLYILFLPADIREDLLEGNATGTSGGSSDTHLNRTLLVEHPGTMNKLEFREYDHYIPSVNLYTRTGANVLKKVSSVYVVNNVFDSKSASFNFEVPDLDNTENILISFSLKQHEGRLIVFVNGYEVMNTEITKSNIEPLQIEKSFLKEDNLVEFMVSSVGWAFWKTHAYTIENIQVTADVTDVSEQQSRNVFMVSDTEKMNIKAVKLKFLPDCTPGSVGVLEAYINGRSVYSAVPDCGLLRPVEFSKEYIKEGENNVAFRTDKGRYLIDQISVETELKAVVYPTYYFEISDDEYNDIVDGNLDVNLTLKFLGDVDEQKNGKVYVNSHLTSFDVYSNDWHRNIKNNVRKGNNGIKIEPGQDTLDIIEIRAELLEN